MSVNKLYSYLTEVATVVLNRCITDNKSKDVPENHWRYCITYNYEYLEDYLEEDVGTFDLDSLSSFGSNKSDQNVDADKPE